MGPKELVGCIFLLGLTALAAPAHAAAPGVGGQVVGGSGTITGSGNTTVINQSSQNMIVHWDNFDIGANQAVIFNQPNSNAAALNRIFEQGPTEIFGSLSANGRVLLVNPYGIVFGQNASVNVGALFATTFNIDDADFMAGDWNFSALPNGPNGIIVNHGLLAAANGGSINLFGGGVVNDGLIIANYGQVNLAAGSTATIDFDGDGLIRFAVDGEVLENAAGLQAAVSNSGTIQAESGAVLLQANVAQDVFAQAVNNSGVIQASGVVSDGGRVFLVGTGGDVVNSGRLDVASDTAQGGSIHVLSDQNVTLAGSAVLDASGASGGGEILVGGDYQGSNPDIANAANTTIESGARLDADAIENGNGGQVIVWSDGTTEVHGAISARGGNASGNGGFVEVSGKEHLWLSELVDLRAPQGDFGTLLLDPGTVFICDEAATCAGTQTGLDTFSDDHLSSQLASANVIIDTSAASNANGAAEDIIFQDAGININWAATTSLTLTAGNNVTLTGAINGSDPGSALVINFGQLGTGGTLDFGDAAITVNDITVTGGAGADILDLNTATFTVAGTFSTDGAGGSDQITGQDAGHTWNITGAGAGNITGLLDSFTNFETLQGGTGADTDRKSVV